MKLVSAKFENFRLLRNVEVAFSTEDDANLTVVRAENESGKTTLHTALQWTLFGDEALPTRFAKNFRLHPIDWDIEESTRVPVSGEVEFVHSYTGRGDAAEEIERYVARRKVIEIIEGEDEWEREGERFELFLVTEGGYEPQDEGELKVEQILESNLKDLFFTDGDRALTFISSELRRGEKRKRVKQALRDMLGLELLDKAQTHVRGATADIRGQAGAEAESDKLDELADRLEELEGDIETAEQSLAVEEDRADDLEEQIDEIDSEIDKALRHGNREELANQLEKTKNRIESGRKRRKEATKSLGELFHSSSFAGETIGSLVRKACQELDELRERGEIPRTAVRVLKECLADQECICGRSLPEGSEHRAMVKELIEKQGGQSQVEERLTQLRFAGQELLTTWEEGSWTEQVADVVEDWENAESEVSDARSTAKELEVKLDKIEGTDVPFLRERRADLKQQWRDAQKEIAGLEADLASWNEEYSNRKAEWKRLTRREAKAERTRSRVEASEDILQVLNEAYATIEEEEIPEVSSAMNDYFLAMIKADPKQNAIIRRAEVSQEYDIVVFGTNDRRLDTDRDLNGASRRALTLSFLLGLAEVSGVEAPNVIDTPLGMTSGQVKRSILKTAIQRSSQIVLLLTRSEIRGTEDIVDEAAGEVVTLTNSAHYPTMLSNDPGTEVQEVVACSCDHREYCDTCMRSGDKEKENLVYCD